MIRKSIRVFGQVQGVGFRYRASYAAKELGLTGWVENLWDGSVQIEIQGPRLQVEKFLPAVKEGSFVRIDYAEETEIDVVEDERRFRVRGY